jgi:hypothetical protein
MVSKGAPPIALAKMLRSGQYRITVFLNRRRFDVSGVNPRPHQYHDRDCATLEKHKFPRSRRVARATRSSRPGSVIGD